MSVVFIAYNFFILFHSRVFLFFISFHVRVFKAEPHLLASKSFSVYSHVSSEKIGSFTRVLIIDSTSGDKEGVDENTSKDIKSMKRDADWGGKAARKEAMYGITEENKNNGKESIGYNDIHEDSNRLVKVMKDLNLLVCEWSELSYGNDVESLKREIKEFYSCVLFVLNEKDLTTDHSKCFVFVLFCFILFYFILFYFILFI